MKWYNNDNNDSNDTQDNKDNQDNKENHDNRIFPLFQPYFVSYWFGLFCRFHLVLVIFAPN